MCYSWVHRAAHILANEGARGVEQLRREHRKLLYEMSSRKEEAGALSGAVSLFLKVSKSYWKGLFRSYRFPDLPHQQRPEAPLRLRTLRRAACQWQERSIAGDGGAWLGACGRRRGHASRRVRRSGHTSDRPQKMADHAGFARKRRENRRAQLRFRRDPQAYLGGPKSSYSSRFCRPSFFFGTRGQER
jgi:hypothetical protein